MVRTPKSPPKDNIKALQQGWSLLATHPMFRGLTGSASLRWTEPKQPFAKDGFAYVEVGVRPNRYSRAANARGFDYVFAIVANGRRRASPPEWTNIFAQALLHIVMAHVDPRRADIPWRRACEYLAADLLRHLSAGERPPDIAYPDVGAPGRTPEAAAEQIARDGVEAWPGCGIAGFSQDSWIYVEKPPPFDSAMTKQLTDVLADAIRANIMSAVEGAGATARASGVRKGNPSSRFERARRWFVASYPLLASLASAFEIIEDADICAMNDIRIAAVDPELRQMYVNPHFPWPGMAAIRFVIAHELLHVGLSHAARRQGRDAYLWNVACDYVINAWLIEMDFGEPPTPDLLFDEALGFERDSAEAVYDRIVKDLRLMRRLGKFMTLRGVGKGDMLGERPTGWWSGAGCDLDTFYRRALAEGLDLHVQNGRGLLPGDLVEEVRALQHPPIPWDVKLGQWLDAFFPPLERRRSYARASRRQSATPDIPRPVYQKPLERMASRTFGVVVDTSGSMPANLIARAFGAIASYAQSREVEMVRVVQCDAGAHDMGYVESERLLERIEVRGRGGTTLRPAIEKLGHAEDFPKDAPILIITDGMCDSFAMHREHAFLMPKGARLPFYTKAPVFHFEKPES